MSVGMDVNKIQNHEFDYDNVKDVNLSPTMEDEWGLTRLTASGMFKTDFETLITAMDVYIFGHEFNRGNGESNKPATTQSIVNGFNPLAFGQVTAAVFCNDQGSSKYPSKFLMLADNHNRRSGLLRAYKKGTLTPHDLKQDVFIRVIPASQFIEIYGLLNTCRSQSGVEKYTHPTLRYGTAIFRLMQKAGIDTIDKSFAGQLAYILEYLESSNVSQNTMYADTWYVRKDTRKKALNRSISDPLNVAPHKLNKLSQALQWLTAVQNSVDKNTGGKLLANAPFRGMLLLWHMRGESVIGKTASGFARKLNNKAVDLKPLMSCITHSGDDEVQNTELRILKKL